MLCLYNSPGASAGGRFLPGSAILLESLPSRLRHPRQVAADLLRRIESALWGNSATFVVPNEALDTRGFALGVDRDASFLASSRLTEAIPTRSFYQN